MKTPTYGGKVRVKRPRREQQIGTAGRSRRTPPVLRVRGTEQHRDNGPEQFSVNEGRREPKLTGRANAMTRGKGKKVGLRRISKA